MIDVVSIEADDGWYCCSMMMMTEDGDDQGGWLSMMQMIDHIVDRWSCRSNRLMIKYVVLPVVGFASRVVNCPFAYLKFCSDWLMRIFKQGFSKLLFLQTWGAQELKLLTWEHSSVVRAADCRSSGPWFKSGCALLSLRGVASSSCTCSFLTKAP